MKLILLLALVLTGISYSKKQEADLLVYNGTIYTVDASFSTAEAMAVKDGKIIGVGTKADLEAKFDSRKQLDAHGQFIYPGFIDAHAHFLEYGLSLNKADLTGSTSWNEVVERLKIFAKNNPTGWLMGEGWDQNRWPGKEFPTNDLLNQLFPDRPVLLGRVDGHALIANKKALDIAGVKPGDKVSGGEVQEKDGKLTGVFVDNAMDLIWSVVPGADVRTIVKALNSAQQNCFAVGLTTVDNCGTSYRDVLLFDSLQRTGVLKMRIYAMLSDWSPNYGFAKAKGKIKTDRLHVCGFKVFADGALGSRGACLLQPYSDKPGSSGFLLNTISHYDSVANVISQMGWQMCTHAIGDSGNRMILHIYARYLKGKNDLRWRVEHAQVINEEDFRYFGDYNIIPSVQPTHATSDMRWAGDRLGKERVKGAYAYKQLLDQNGWIPLGTDFPVEDISPLKTFYAAVTRKDINGWPEAGFQMENALSREETLRGMTIWAAKSNFEDMEKGSLEVGKFADFVILDSDLMKMPAEKILKASVQKTFLNGEQVFSK